MTRGGYRILGVAVAGAAAFVGLRFVCQAAWSGLFEVNNPSSFALLYYTWRILAYVVPGMVVGLFAARRVVVTTLIAYGLGYVFLIAHNFRSEFYEVPDSVRWWQVAMTVIRELALAPLVGVGVALVVAHLRKRIIERLGRDQVETVRRN
jgi:hypothetical protein